MEDGAPIPLYKCPRCGEYPGGGQFHNVLITANDGGSISCINCGCLHHMCVSGVKKGSPGPALCPHCSGTNRRGILNAPLPVAPAVSDALYIPEIRQQSIPPTPDCAGNVDMRLPYSVRAMHSGYK
jgi:hypothetical protein